MPDLGPDTLVTLKDCYPVYYIIQNPIDVTGSGTSSDYAAGIEALLRDPNIDIVMPWFVFPDTPLEEDSLFMLGECQFFSDEYSNAEETYDRLLKKYVFSRHMERAQAGRGLRHARRFHTPHPMQRRPGRVSPVRARRVHRGRSTRGAHAGPRASA